MLPIVNTLQTGYPAIFIMKLFVNARFLSQPVSGVQRYAIECSRKIKNLCPDTVFLTHKNIHNIEVAKELDAVEIGKKTGHLWEQIDLPKYLRNAGSPALFNPCNTAPLSYENNYITIHDLAFYFHPEWNSALFSKWYNFLVPRIAKRAKHIFTVSNTARNELLKTYSLSESKVSVTYNGISQEMLSGQMNTAEKEPIVLAVGSFNLRKNHRQLIQAFMASDIRHSHKLVIVGDKSKVFSDTGLNEQDLTAGNIEVHSALSERELVSLYGRAKIVASISSYEGFGIPVLEGIYNGCSIICSDIPVYKELYKEFAIFCQPHSIDSIVRALDTCASTAPPEKHLVDTLLQKCSYQLSAEKIVSVIGSRN